MMRGMAWFCALMLAAVAQGVVGFHVTPGVQLSWKSTLVRASRAHPSVRIARPLHALRAQIHTRDGTHQGLTGAADEDASLAEYSPRAGEKASPLKRGMSNSMRMELMAPAQYLAALTDVAAELDGKGMRLLWVGGGQDTFYQALGVALHNVGITRPVGSTGSTATVGPGGYDFTPAATGLEGTFPAACRQIRLDLVRCIISNVERLGQHTVGAERDLHAAAMRYQVCITCFEVSDNGAIKKAEYLPQSGVDCRADLFFVRKGEHFIAARAMQGSLNGTGDTDSIFANIKEADVLLDMREKAQYIGLKCEESGSPSQDAGETPLQRDGPPAKLQREIAGAQVFTLASGPPKNVRGGRKLLRQVVQVQEDARLDMPEKHYSAGGNNFFTAFAAALRATSVPIKSKSVAVGKTGQGSVLATEEAARLARSEVIMYASAHAARFGDMPSPVKEMAAAADKFRVHITCFALSKGVVSKSEYTPKDGVAARAKLVLACDGDKFWATLPSAQLAAADAALESAPDDIREIPAGADIPVGYEEGEEEEAGADVPKPTSAAALQAINEADDAAPEDRSVFFDKKTLSWKMMTKEEQAKQQAEASAERAPADATEGKSGNYLPRFSRFRSNPNAEAPPSSKATVGDAMIASAISGRNGRVNVDPVALAQRRASAGITNDVQISEGMLQLEARLAERGKVIDLNQGGGNAYLVVAELMHHHKLEIQGLMFSMWGEERRKALVGAMSRKAREDVKTYMYHNPQVLPYTQHPTPHTLHRIS